jgi:hypothetical protein
MADVLPNAELRNVLYPTEPMKQAVAVLYLQILEILQRAAEWYRGGKIKHLLGSIARPWALHFSDLVGDISAAARNVDKLAIGASMAEQRDMHLEQQEMRLEQRKTHALLEELKRVTEGRQGPNSATWLFTLTKPHRVSKIEPGYAPRYQQKSL